MTRILEHIVEEGSDSEEETKEAIEACSDEDDTSGHEALAGDGGGSATAATGGTGTLRHRSRGNQPSPRDREQRPHQQEDENTPIVTNRRSSRLSYSASKQLMKIRDVFSPPRLSFLSPPQLEKRRNPTKKKAQSPVNSEGRDDGDADHVDDSAEYRGPTDLHNICRAATNADSLQDAKYFQFPQSDRESRTAKAFSIVQREASVSDEDGRHPLHLLSQNQKLSRSITQDPSHDTSAEKRMDTVEVGAIVDFVVNFLLPAHPSAVIEKDCEGHIPFEHGLVEWISDCHVAEFGLKRSDSSSTFVGIENSIQQVQNAVNNSINVSKAALAKAGRSLHLSATSTSQSFRRESSELALSRSGSGTIETSGSNDTITSPERSEDNEVLTYDEEAGSGARQNDSQPTEDYLRHDKKSLVAKPGLRFPLANRSMERLFPLHVRLSSHAKLSLLALSAILTKLEEDAKAERRVSFRSGDVNGDVTSDVLKSRIIESIASIPNLIKTLLLIDDQVERDGVFDLSIIRHVMLCGSSMGTWFTWMLRSENKVVSKRAVDYLQLLSDVSEGDRNERLANGTLSRDSAKRDELPEAVLVLEDLIPSMLGLDEKAIEHAATTPIIRRVLDTMITRPFAVSVIFCDGLFLLLLILSFRKSADGYVEGKAPETVIKWIYIANANIFYFVIRELAKAVSLSMITRRTFWLKFFWGFWNQIDIWSIVLALCSTIAMRINFSHDVSLGEESSGLRWCLAVTTGMLWLKVLAFLKSINHLLATFVLAVLQITKDILWFLLILLAAIVSFAQMFYTLLLPEECATGGADANSGHCSIREYYLKVYSILLGDFGEFERENFHTPFAVFLFVLFSFMVVIVLLNVLIAIVSDSYEKCLIRSQYLFGRARVMILAELISFQNLLGKDDEPVQYDRSDTHVFRRCWVKQRSKGWSHGSLIFFALSALVVLLWFIAEFMGYASGEHYGDITFSLGSIFVNVALLMIIIAFLSHGTSGMTESSEATETVRHYTCWHKNSIQKCMVRLLGTSEAASLEKQDYESEEWRGRANYIQREMTRISTESMAQTKAEMKTLESELIGADNRIWTQISSLERRMTESEATVKAEIKASEQRIEMILRDIVLALGENSKIKVDSTLLRSSA